jgi:hypothetical protein
MRKMKILVTAVLILTGITGYSQKLESGNVLSVHNVEITLDNGMTIAQVEKFIEDEYIPAIEKNFPDVKMMMMKGERGALAEKYSYLVIFKSIDERNRWFPESGKMSEETKQVLKNMQDLENKFNSMIKSSSWTNFVIL